MRALLAFALLLAATSTAHAGDTAFTWLGDITGQRGGSKALSAHGYLAGVADGLDAAEFPQICLPDGLQYGILRTVAIAWIQAHAKEQHLPATVAFILAWREAWPCAAKK